MNEQITDRGTQKCLHTKFHTMNIMRSGAQLIKYDISSNIRQARCGHAFGIHESRQVYLIALIKVGRSTRAKEIQQRFLVSSEKRRF